MSDVQLDTWAQQRDDTSHVPVSKREHSTKVSAVPAGDCGRTSARAAWQRLAHRMELELVRCVYDESATPGST